MKTAKQQAYQAMEQMIDGVQDEVIPYSHSQSLLLASSSFTIRSSRVITQRGVTLW